MRVTRAVPVGLLLLSLGALAGCQALPGGDGSQADRVVRGIPTPWIAAPQPTPGEGSSVGWTADDEFGVVTMGSGSCPAVAGALRVVSASEVAVEFRQSPRTTCTADMAPTTHLFRLPADVSEEPVTVVVSFEDWPEVERLELPVR